MNQFDLIHRSRISHSITEEINTKLRHILKFILVYKANLNKFQRTEIISVYPLTNTELNYRMELKITRKIFKHLEIRPKCLR